MRQKNIRQYIGITLASILIATYPTSLVGAQMTPPTTDGIHAPETSSVPIKKLQEQGLSLDQFISELQHLYESKQSDIQKREQNSLSLRDFSIPNLFSCRGFA
jgi:hypothetical protein